MTKAENDR